MMTRFNRLVDALKDRYHNAPEGEKVLAINVFAIEFADELKQVEEKDRKEIALLGTTKISYATEINKGMKLAKYVQLKPEAKS